MRISKVFFYLKYNNLESEVIMIKNNLEKEKSISIITKGSIAGLSYSYSDNSFDYLNHILMYDYYSEIEKNEFYEWVNPKEPIVS